MSDRVLQDPVLLDHIIAYASWKDLQSFAIVNSDFHRSASKELYRDICAIVLNKVQGTFGEYAPPNRREIYLDAVRSVRFSYPAKLLEGLPSFITGPRRNVRRLLCTTTRTIDYQDFQPWWALRSDCDRPRYQVDIDLDLERKLVTEEFQVYILKPNASNGDRWTLAVPERLHQEYPSDFKVLYRLQPKIFHPPVVREKNGVRIYRESVFGWSDFKVKPISLQELTRTPTMETSAGREAATAWLEERSLSFDTLSVMHPPLYPADFRVMASMPNISRLRFSLASSQGYCVSDLVDAIQLRRPDSSVITLETDFVDTPLRLATIPELLLSVGRTPWIKHTQLVFPYTHTSLVEFLCACRALQPVGNRSMLNGSEWRIDLLLHTHTSTDAATVAARAIADRLQALNLETCLEKLSIRFLANYQQFMTFSWCRGREGLEMRWEGSLPAHSDDED